MQSYFPQDKTSETGEYWRLGKFVNKYWYFFIISLKWLLVRKCQWISIFDWLLGIRLKVPHFNICFPFRSFLLKIDVWQENWKWLDVNKLFLALFVKFNFVSIKFLVIFAVVILIFKNIFYGHKFLVLHLFLKSIQNQAT